MQEILVIVRTWLYQAALDPVVAEEASLRRPLSPAQAPRKGREWILAARRAEEPDRVAGGTPASQYAGAQQPMSACVTAVSRAHPVVLGPFCVFRTRSNPQPNGASSNEQPSEPARIVDVERQKYLTPNTPGASARHVATCAAITDRSVRVVWARLSAHSRAVSGPRPPPLTVVRRTRRSGATRRRLCVLRQIGSWSPASRFLLRSKMARVLWPVDMATRSGTLARIRLRAAAAIVEEAGRHAGRLTGRHARQRRTGMPSRWKTSGLSGSRRTRGGALLHEYPLPVGRRGSHFSGPSAGATLRE